MPAPLIQAPPGWFSQTTGYTESSQKFSIPETLTNRADMYNLDHVVGQNADLFDMSYLENCITSNLVRDKPASRSPKDVYGIIDVAETGAQERVELEGSYSCAGCTQRRRPGTPWLAAPSALGYDNRVWTGWLASF